MQAQKPSLVLAEFNEVNFDFVRRYVERGELPNLARSIREWGIVRTSSENRYEELEPWIQWVTAHTGRSLAEHHVFRLGDIVGRPVEQIWEVLERKGLRVGAVSPINAENRLESPAFFVPDPWTDTRASGPALLRDLSAALRQAVNENAAGRLTLFSIATLARSLLAYAPPRHWPAYAADGLRGLRLHWPRAIFLDRLIADTFVTHWRAQRPQFASLFLNGCAHVQHHYLFNSAVYEGRERNPDWYVRADRDPVLEILRLYDRILGGLLELPGSPRIIVATGLHQTPIAKPVYYWRLADHARFVRRLGISPIRVEPRMSRDFLLVFAAPEETDRAAAVLAAGVDSAGVPIFEVDNRGDSVFVTLSYPHDIGRSMRVRFGAGEPVDLRAEVLFVALKNAEHNGTGFLLDSGDRHPAAAEVPLASLFSRVCGALGA